MCIRDRGFIGAGGAPPADMGLAGSCGTALAIAQDLSSSAALAIAVPIGVLGLFLNTGKMTWNSFFTGPCEKAGRAGNLKGVFFWNVVVPVSYTHLDVYKRQDYHLTDRLRQIHACPI